MLSDGRRSFTYDAMNRLSQVTTTEGNIQKNCYDGEGLRAEMEENGRLVSFLFDGQKVAAETDCDQNTIRYIRGYELISSDSEKAKTYYHYASDEMGSITHITDETGNVCNHYEYDAFGDFTVKEETIENRFGFTGEQYDPIAGLYYLRARFYNPVIGRFIQEDTYYGDGLNLYSYCQNNPVKYIDPSGHGKVCPQKNAGINILKKAGIPIEELENAYKDIRNKCNNSMDALEEIVKKYGTDADKRITDFINGKSSFEDVLDDYVQIYKDNVNSNKPWAWNTDVLGGELLNSKNRKSIRNNAINSGLVTQVDIVKVNGLRIANFRDAGVVKVSLPLPKELWLATDDVQFKYLDELYGKNRAGYTWHHSEIPG